MGGHARRISGVWLLGLLLGLGGAQAQADIQVQLHITPRQAEPGELLTLVIEVRGAQNVEPPALSGLDGFDTRYIGPSTQMSIVNNRYSASVRHRYTLRARQEGRFTFGPFRLKHQGREYQTGTVEVDIRSGRPAAGPPSPDRALGDRSDPSGEGLWLEIRTPKREVFLHQPIPLEVMLYIGGMRIADAQYPVLPGDGVSLEPFEEPVRQRRTVRGDMFRVLRFRTTVVPLRSGTIELGPASLQLSVIRPVPRGSPSLFDRFFSDSLLGTERRPRTLHSNALSLRVAPLPEEGRPATFSGAVGQFRMEVTADPTQLQVGDPLTLRMLLSGNGQVTDAQPPGLVNTDGFRTYPPQMDRPNPDTTVFEQVLIPQDKMLEAIPAVHFSYFDPEVAQYRTLTSQPIRLLLRPAPKGQRVGVVGGRVPSERLGRDIVYIKDELGPLHNQVTGMRLICGIDRIVAVAGSSCSSIESGPSWSVFALWHIVPLGLFGVAVWCDRRRLSRDAGYARFARAGRQARHGLGAAERALGESDPATFYDLLSRAVQEYLAAKLDLPPGQIEAGPIAQRGVSADCASRIAEILAVCERVRFAPGMGAGDMPGVLRAARDLVGQLEKEKPEPCGARQVSGFSL